MALSKRERFEIFKRDKFTCQYCGRAAPDVTLEVDHVHPVSEGGSDDPLNLVTSCRDCNSGKSNRLLSDDTAIAQRKRQLDELQERREQLDMLVEWHRSLLDLDEQAVTQLAGLWSACVPGYSLNDLGLANLKQWIKKFGTAEVAEAMHLASAQYLEYDQDSQKPTRDSVEVAWQYVPRICGVRRTEAKKPYLKELLYIRGIMRNRFSYVPKDMVQRLEAAVRAGISTGDLADLARNSRHWSAFRETFEQWMEDVGS